MFSENYDHHRSSFVVKIGYCDEVSALIPCLTTITEQMILRTSKNVKAFLQDFASGIPRNSEFCFETFKD